MKSNLLSKIEAVILSSGHYPADFCLLTRSSSEAIFACEASFIELHFLRDLKRYPTQMDFYKAFSQKFAHITQIKRLASHEPNDPFVMEVLEAVRIQTSLPSWSLIFLEDQQPAFLWTPH